MLVSVIIPAYNDADYLREAIQSALNQTHAEIEVIIVDDGSTDHTREVCESFGSRVKYFYQENDGTQGIAARRQAILHSRGDAIAFLDQDDRWKPTKIQRQLEILSSHPGAGVIFTSYCLIDEEGKVCSSVFPTGPTGEVFHDLLRRNWYCNASALVPRKVIGRCGAPDPEAGMDDWDMWLHIARYYKVYVVEECLTEYRIHSQSTSADIIKILARCRQMLPRQKSRLHLNCSVCRKSLALGRATIALGYAYHALLMTRAGQWREIASSVIAFFELIPCRVFLPWNALTLIKILLDARENSKVFRQTQTQT